MLTCCFLHPIQGFCHPHDAMMLCIATCTQYEAKQEVMPSILHHSAFKIRTASWFALLSKKKKKADSKCIDNLRHPVKTDQWRDLWEWKQHTASACPFVVFSMWFRQKLPLKKRNPSEKSWISGILTASKAYENPTENFSIYLGGNVQILLWKGAIAIENRELRRPVLLASWQIFRNINRSPYEETEAFLCFIHTHNLTDSLTAFPKFLFPLFYWICSSLLYPVAGRTTLLFS